MLSRSNGEGPVDEACFLLLNKIGVYNGVRSMPYINLYTTLISFVFQNKNPKLLLSQICSMR
jgi:hypothetical protein